MINIHDVAISTRQNPNNVTDWLPIFYLAQKKVGIVDEQFNRNFGGTIFFQQEIISSVVLYSCSNP